jgi:membrane fusion protein (multidrug efflux system)
MNRRNRNLLVVAVVFAALAAFFGLRIHQLGQDTALASIRSVRETEGIPVETARAERGELARWTTLAGTVEGTVQYPVVSNNSLRVVGIPVREGDRVAAGDVIIRLATDAPSPMYHSVAQSRARYQQALVDTRRLRNLFAEGAVSRSELDAAETNLEVLASDLQNAEGSTLLTASEAGVVASILVTEGETASAGKPLAWIADTREVKVVFSAGSHQALSLKTGQLAVWTSPEGERLRGELAQLDLLADPETHLLDGEVRFANPDGRLVPGLLLSFEVRTDQREDALLVPSACIVEEGGQPAVWVVADTASLVPVTTGLATTDAVEILAGLEPGQQVVRHGQTLLSAGAKVKVVADEGGR